MIFLLLNNAESPVVRSVMVYAVECCCLVVCCVFVLPDRWTDDYFLWGDGYYFS